MPDATLCPSAPLKEGAVLLGIVMPDGRVAFAGDRLIVNDGFVLDALEGRVAETGFRFAGPCVQGGCSHWTGARCRAFDSLPADGQFAGPEPSLPACSIRSQCRWFQQTGAGACRACLLLVTVCQRPA